MITVITTSGINKSADKSSLSLVKTVCLGCLVRHKHLCVFTEETENIGLSEGSVVGRSDKRASAIQGCYYLFSLLTHSQQQNVLGNIVKRRGDS